jgi:hypothetical protein
MFRVSKCHKHIGERVFPMKDFRHGLLVDSQLLRKEQDRLTNELQGISAQLQPNLPLCSPLAAIVAGPSDHEGPEQNRLVPI